MNEAQFLAVVQCVREGDTLTAALLKHEIPQSTFFAFRAKDPMRGEMMARARIDMTHSLVDQAVDIVDSEPNPQRARVRAEIRLKVAQKLNPAEFSDRIDLTVTPGPDPALLHDQGRQRVRLMRDLAPALGVQVIEDAVLVPAGSTGSTSADPSIWD